MAGTLQDLAAGLHRFFAEKVPGAAGDAPGDMLLVFDALGVPLDPREFGATADGVPLDVFANQRAAELADQLPAANVLSGGSYLPRSGSRLSRWYDALVSSSAAVATTDPELGAFERRKANALESFEENKTLDVAMPGVGVGVVGEADHHYATSMSPRGWFLPDSQAWSTFTQSGGEDPPVVEPPGPLPIPIPEWELRVVEPEPPPEVVRFIVNAEVLAERKIIAVDPPNTLPVGELAFQPGLRVGHEIQRLNLQEVLVQPVDVEAGEVEAGEAKVGEAKVGEVDVGEVVRLDQVAHLDEAVALRPFAGRALAGRVPVADEGLATIAEVVHPELVTTFSAANLQTIIDASTTQTVQTQGFSVSFDYTIVSFERPWWDEVFLNVPGWRAAGFSRGQLASGKASEPAAQFITLLTCGMVVVRNLRIQAAWDSTDLAAAGSATSLGPFCIAGAQWNEQELRRPGLQVIAWICQIPSVLPPD